jgi:proline dehydrogenase
MQKEAIRFDDTARAFASKSTKELRKSHFLFSTMGHPWMVKTGVFMTNLALTLRLPVKGMIRRTLFDQFCGGESITDCQHTIDHLAEVKVHTILDYSVEGAGDEASFDAACDEIVRVAEYAKTHKAIPFVVVKPTGIGSIEVMTRAQTGAPLSPDDTQALANMKGRLHRLAEHARSNGLQFMVDAEESWIQDVIDDMVEELMAEFNTEKPIVFNTYQFYRHDALARMKASIEAARKGGYHVGYKLVRGAYMEKERERAEKLGYSDPIQPDKASTDRDYDEALTYCMEHIDRVAICAGTHNEKSAQLLVDLLEEKDLAKDHPNVYFAQLLGMSDNISFLLADMGYNVAKYVPYGPVQKVLPYLFRRAEENTSIAGQSGRELTLVKKELKRRKSA